MTKEGDFLKKAKCKIGLCSSMSNSTWCDLNNKVDILKLPHDLSSNPKSKCQKQIYFTPNQFQMEGSGFKKSMKKVSKWTEKTWNIFIKPGLKIATPIILTGVAANTKNPQSAQSTSNILKWLTGGEISPLTHMHGIGLRLRVM